MKNPTPTQNDILIALSIVKITLVAHQKLQIKKLKLNSSKLKIG